MSKKTNPKDAVGTKKPRFYSGLPANVTKEVTIGVMEGAMKYGRHNYRIAGVRASTYIDATIGHLLDYWEGQDIDPDSGLHHITKAIASLYVLRDAQMRNMCEDDRPPKSDVEGDKTRLQAIVNKLFEKYPNPVPAYKEGDVKLRRPHE
tara:strand:+ start:226 stop:672 length:447 start_codon:yes stop_codon:yes gene_type:complete